MKIEYNQQRRFLQKWGLLLGIIFLLTMITVTILFYLDIEKRKYADHPQTEKTVLSDTELIHIDQIEKFNGADSFHIVYGQTDNEEKKIAFVPLTNTKLKISIIDQDEIVSESVIRKEWEEECNDCKLIKIVPGIVDEKEIWELTYIDKTNRYVLEYRSIYDGSHYEKFKFTQLFN